MKGLLAEKIAFYKKHRSFIQSSVAIPLTKVEPITERYGIAAIQLSSLDFRKNMVFVYNLFSLENPVVIKPYGLDEDGNPLREPKTGADMIGNGLQIECYAGQARAIIVDRE